MHSCATDARSSLAGVLPETWKVRSPDDAPRESLTLSSDVPVPQDLMWGLNVAHLHLRDLDLDLLVR